MIYQLSDDGRELPLNAWRKMGGCGFPNSTNVYIKLGPERSWPKDISLGRIEDACPFTGRSLARFAVTHLNKPELAKPYQKEA